MTTSDDPILTEAAKLEPVHPEWVELAMTRDALVEAALEMADSQAFLHEISIVKDPTGWDTALRRCTESLGKNEAAAAQYRAVRP